MLGQLGVNCRAGRPRSRRRFDGLQSKVPFFFGCSRTNLPSRSWTSTKHGVDTLSAMFAVPSMPPASNLVSVGIPTRRNERRVNPFTPTSATVALAALSKREASGPAVDRESIRLVPPNVFEEASQRRVRRCFLERQEVHGDVLSFHHRGVGLQRLVVTPDGAFPDRCAGRRDPGAALRSAVRGHR